MKSLPSLLFVFILGLSIAPFTGMAQVDPCGDPNVLNCDCPESQGDPLCPIDGGVVLLIAAGMGLGAKKLMAEKQKNAPAATR